MTVPVRDTAEDAVPPYMLPVECALKVPPAEALLLPASLAVTLPVPVLALLLLGQGEAEAEAQALSLGTCDEDPMEEPEAVLVPPTPSPLLGVAELLGAVLPLALTVPALVSLRVAVAQRVREGVGLTEGLEDALPPLPLTVP